MLEYLNAIKPLYEEEDKERLLRAQALGFDITVKWYHGGFSYFRSFDKSGTGSYNFTRDKNFAEQYASTKSMDSGHDYDVIVRVFYLPKKLFDFRNKEHLQSLKNILPNHLKIAGRYGWSAWHGEQSYDKETLIELIQGINEPYVGLSEEALHDIRNGKTEFRKDGGICHVINYDKNTDTLEYIERWEMDAINGLKANIEYYEKEDPTYYGLSEMKRKYKAKMDELTPYKLQLSPKKKDGYDNWEILESPELRPYLQKLGFLGTLMQEKKHLNCAIFDNRKIRSIDAEFNLDHKNSSDIMA
jgi:hypothetical protein